MPFYQITSIFFVFDILTRSYSIFSDLSRASFRRKSSAVLLCKSIESAIQWFLIQHGITFVTIHNPAVYLSGARVRISPTLVPDYNSHLAMHMRIEYISTY